MARVWLMLLFAIWAGVVIGVSFVATPAKFHAPSLSMAVALDVGRHTFRTLGWVESGLAVAALLPCWLTRATNSLAVWGLGAVWFLFLVERLWLLPILDERVSSYLAGSPPEASYHHVLFIGLEALKVVVLICAAIATGRSTRRSALNG